MGSHPYTYIKSDSELFSIKPQSNFKSPIPNTLHFTMSVVTTAELVNEGHNILDRGIGIAYDAHSKNTKVIYRSRVGLDAAGGNVTYLASTELGTPGWSSPIQVTKPRDRAVSAEFLAYVIPDHPAGTPDIHNVS